jgi:hypothetical protein
LKGFDYIVEKQSDNTFKLSFLQQSVATKDQVDNWLKEFGIVLHPNTLDELMTKGLFHNYKQRKPDELFDSSSNTNGLFGILYNQLKTLLAKPETIFGEEGNIPLDNSVINSLANLESKYNDVNTPFGFRDGGKSCLP